MKPHEVVVLVLDDDDIVRLNLAAFLEDEGFDVLAASSGEEALAAMVGRHVHVAVVDLRLPGMTGHETMQQAHRLCPTTEFLVYSGSPDAVYVPSTRRPGVESNELFRKPLRDLRVLADAILRLAEESEPSRPQRLGCER